jgi:hypothetical protein
MSAEQRLSERLLSYWNVLRKDEPMPDFSHFNSSAIDDLWQQCILFTVSPALDNKTAALNFYQIGDKLGNIYGANMIGRSFTAGQQHFQGASIVRRMQDILENPVPITDMGQFINEKSKVVKFRSCLLPFGRNGKVTHVITGLSWREF